MECIIPVEIKFLLSARRSEYLWFEKIILCYNEYV